MRTLNLQQTSKNIRILSLSLFVFGTALIAQPTFEINDDNIEEEIQIEEWMTNYESFDSNLNRDDYFEAPILIQRWMLDSNELVPGLDENHTEDALAIEDWMLNFNTFCPKEQTLDEPSITIHDWMLDYNKFASKTINFSELLAEQEEEPIKIEAWMINLDAFDIPTLSFISSIKNIELGQVKPLLVALKDVK